MLAAVNRIAAPVSSSRPCWTSRCWRSQTPPEVTSADTQAGKWRCVAWRSPLVPLSVAAVRWRTAVDDRCLSAVAGNPDSKKNKHAEDKLCNKKSIFKSRHRPRCYVDTICNIYTFSAIGMINIIPIQNFIHCFNVHSVITNDCFAYPLCFDLL